MGQSLGSLKQKAQPHHAPTTAYLIVGHRVVFTCFGTKGGREVCALAMVHAALTHAWRAGTAHVQDRKRPGWADGLLQDVHALRAEQATQGLRMPLSGPTRDCSHGVGGCAASGRGQAGWRQSAGCTRAAVPPAFSKSS
jgi:hypothetical protein